MNASQFAVVAGGAAGDPASLGVAWILAGLSQSALNVSYAAMVKEEMGFLTGTVLRTHDGAISTRPLSEPVQLWADFVCEGSSLNDTRRGEVLIISFWNPFQTWFPRFWVSAPGDGRCRRTFAEGPRTDHSSPPPLSSVSKQHITGY